MQRSGAHSAMTEARIPEEHLENMLGLGQRPSRQYFAMVVAVAAGSCG